MKSRTVVLAMVMVAIAGSTRMLALRVAGGQTARGKARVAPRSLG